MRRRPEEVQVRCGGDHPAVVVISAVLRALVVWLATENPIR